MNPVNLPQLESDGQPEIYRLLKIGDYAISAEDGGFVVSNEQTAAVVQSDVVQALKPKIENVIKIASQKVYTTTKPYYGFLIYPIIFVGSFVFFYTAINFPSLAAQAQGIFGKQQDQEVLGKENLAEYNTWIKGYFYSVANKDLLTPNNDFDHDGLTNYDEFVMRTNPTLSDSDADGTTDGVELLNSTNPWGSGKLTSAQGKLRDKVNLNMVSERITYNVSANQGKTMDDNTLNNFDLSKPGVLSIPRLKIQVPLVWSKDPSNFDRDLETGVIHYPGTSLPGSKGIVYVSGHSSDYIWKHDKFATVFTKINFLNPGDDVFVTVYGKDGKVYNYRYRVTGQKVYSPDDQTQFIDNSASRLNLSTCWPIGTSKDRMVVSAELTNL